MNIHEYQAKELYRAYGVPTPLDDGPAQPPDIDPRHAFAR